MSTLSIKGATASTVSAAAPSTLSVGQPLDPGGGGSRREQVRHLLFGPPSAVQATILQLHQLGYAEPNDWSRLLSTGRAGEVMAILTKRISL